jgi:ATP-binding protein involved in chromosome partitioning
MKIAVPTVNDEICMHFGHCEVFTIIDVDSTNNQILSVKKEVPPPHEPGVLPKWIGELGVDVVIAGGMGMRAQQLFAQNGVNVIVGATSGKPESIVKSFLDNTLETGNNVCDH